MGLVVLEMTVLSPDTVVSPITGARGAFVRVEVYEDDDLIAETTFGDLVKLATDGGDLVVELVARRTTFRFASVFLGGLPITGIPAELVPYLARMRRGGALRLREQVVRSGDRLRVRADVEGGTVRDDRLPVILEEILPPFVA